MTARTIIKHKIGTHTVIGGILLGVCVFPLCGLIPCFIDDCKDKIHRCPNCNNFLGIKEYKLF